MSTAPMRATVGRLAPTPSGRLHLGNACAFAGAWLSARHAGGRLLLRIEDVDVGRARADVADAIVDDLAWLGLDWDVVTLPQSARDYAAPRARLAPFVYRCTCTRQQIRDAGGVYPGTCRDAGHSQGAVRFRLPDGAVTFDDRRWGPQQVDPTAFGDPVLVRADGVPAYPLAVVADDIADGVTEVVRGADLLGFTAVQVLLWRALGAAPPTWLHTPLIVGPDGRKLGKSHGSLEVAALRASGWTPSDVWRVVLPWLGSDAAHVHDAVDTFDPEAGPRGPVRVGADLADPPTSR
ncbi:MAG: tRNA glutamyl-Q(34) synthetase GluQRS [Alphaproteobacteria bacterium]|nr:tRNA glutamyl-Q(34) synthetase GluQRS [Alphaproteobacteria bacterium]